MEHFTSRKDKFDLLDQAIARHDGNAITRIIIWLKDTLKRDPNLMKDLMAPDRAVGMNHYICYLKEMKEYDELSELLISLNRYNSNIGLPILTKHFRGTCKFKIGFPWLDPTYNLYL